jgi:actin-related protein
LEENLFLKPNESPLLFTEPSEHNKEHRLKLTEIMFEKLNIPCMFICKNAVLSSFACGKSTCLVLDSGHSTTYAAPVHEGYILHNSTLKYKIGGKYISDRILTYLNQRDIKVLPRYGFKKATENDATRVTPLDMSGYTSSYNDFHVNKIIKMMKEECTVVSDISIHDKKIENIKPYEYELPDGQKFEIGGERCLLPEVFFSGTEMIQNEIRKGGMDVDVEEDVSLKGFKGVQLAVTEAINQTDLDIRKELYSNILATGGNCMMEGFINRLQKEIPDIAPQNLRVKVSSSQSGSSTEY